MTAIDKEIIILNVVWQMIDGMVNRTMFVESDQTQTRELRFKTTTHSKLFLILLVDFLSEVRSFRGRAMPLGFEKPPSNANPSDRTFLFHIRQVCINPQLANDTSRPALATKAFADWLDGFFVVSNIYFPTLNVQMDLHLERCRCLKICGDVVKHSLPRLETNVKHLRTIHEEAGYKVSEQEAYLVLEDFVNWLHNSVFLYHASQIGEFLNNIRWSIYMYLRSEYQSSWHVVGPKAGDIQQYFYNVPSSVSDALSQSMYWDLMNRVRSRPSVEPFLAPDYLKVRY